MITQIRIPIIHCAEGIYLRWWYNGYHYFNFRNGYEVIMTTESMDTQVTRVFSVISKIERPTKLKSKYAYQVEIDGIPSGMIDGFNGLLMAEKVEQYESAKWYEVNVTRNEHEIQETGAPGYKLSFEITRKELPNTPAVFQKSQLLYIGDTLADMDDDEVIPINKQVNDIAEMQDRQSDFTAGFKIRKTRAMRELFELSGEVGANTTFPYEKQSCKLVQEGIEVITSGFMMLDKTDDQYYHVSVYSGNLDFFKNIEGKKLSDLTLSSCNHTWDITTMTASHSGTLDYIYPLCEPSDDGGMAPLTDSGTAVSYYGGWVWPFIKLKTIFDEIISNAGFTYTGDIVTNETFARLYMPIVNREFSEANKTPWLWSIRAKNYNTFNQIVNTLTGGNADVTLISGSGVLALYFKMTGIYIVPYAGKYTFRLYMASPFNLPWVVALYKDETAVAQLLDDGTIAANPIEGSWTCEYDAMPLDHLTIRVTFTHIPIRSVIGYEIQVLDIVQSPLSYGLAVTPRINLPDITQTEFVKMVCNIFGLVPDANGRDRKVNFWNYSELYDNISIARDWSAYLSEREDENEFKFGDYAQNNYLRYKESDDVIKDNGRGIMQVDDATLPVDKDVVTLPVSTCDEVTILTDVRTSRIGFNKYNKDGTAYEEEKTIDPRVVYLSQSPGTKTLTFRSLVSGGSTSSVTGPYKVSSLEVSMSTQIVNYAGLSRMLTKTNLRRAKFNLPVYEVAGFKYNIPIYLAQYKAYFYVNKINNYVPGKLCTIDLIKL